jgi:retron-type reverse transcriptase
MLRCQANVLESVRRVTQVNSGKDTPGVDQMVATTPEERGRLCDQLSGLDLHQVRPVRRVYIPKRQGQRPLGIPTIVDRCVQAMVKNALEPFWEARFEGISYGFRPGRGCHDAIEKVFRFARPTTTRPWVLDADIEGAFNNIGHAALLQAIGNFPARELIKQWLKAGYVEEEMLHATDTGVPQGGVISPLLMNDPAASCGVSKTQRQKISKQFQLNFLAMQPFIVLLGPLILHILTDDFFTAMAPNRTDKVAFGPKLSSPQLLFNRRDSLKNLAGRDTFDDRGDLRWAIARH